MTSTVITKDQLRVISDAMLQALGPLEKKFGVQFRRSKAHYGATGDVTIEILPRDDTGAVVTPEARVFTQLARLYGLEPTDLGRRFTDPRGVTHTITGIRDRGRTRPIVTAANGKQFVWPALDVVRLLLRSPSS